MKKLISLIPILFVLTVFAQHSDEGIKYFEPEDKLVLEKLEEWQDMKFGLLMHWGAYSQWGIVESWSLCPEDYGWCVREKGSSPENYFEYKKEYENLKLTFNPVGFEPENWALAAKDAGMKYVVFTTKHHDGFCMFDSKYTDYKITSPDCPFSVNERANVTKEIFNAFREEGLWAGAYFSKPDWHSEFYWDPKFPPMDRNVNYDPAEHQEKWEKFVEFTHNQILEILSGYGKIDILWLDGGWVAKKSDEEIKSYYQQIAENPGSGFPKTREVNQDIRMDELAAKAREKQPGIIVVDRAVNGPNQNYLTPENRVPETTLPYPWESCIIAGGGWSWVPDAKFMTPKQAIHMLVDIVAKGGNLLYNIAPGPDGKWPEDAYKLLEEMGKWIDVNGDAIYGTRAIYPYKTNNICLTQKKDTKTVFAIYLEDKNLSGLPGLVEVMGIKAANGSKITLLGTNKNLKWENSDSGIQISIPSNIRKSLPCDLAWAFKISELL